MEWLRHRKIRRLLEQAEALDSHRIYYWFLVSDTKPLSEMKAQATELRKRAVELGKTRA